MPEESPGPDRASWLPWLMLLPLAVWLGMTVLRESPLFWRNAGGYPVALREFVLGTYYPFTGLLLLSGGLGITQSIAGGTRLRRSTVVGWLIVAGITGFGLAYAGANNLANLMDGRPLHAHAAEVDFR
jgi:hypothetical protein